jgi:hypothetical protein
LTVLATGKATGIIPMILGLDAWIRGRPGEAEVHWERAYPTSPEAPTIANNLAWALVAHPRPDLRRALAEAYDNLNLSDAMAELQKHFIDLDRLTFPSAVAVS